MEALHTAGIVINRAIALGKPISNIKIHKVLYFLDIWYLVNRNKRLISDESFEAWHYGAVLRSVYKEYALYAGNPIEEEQDLSIYPDDDLDCYAYGYLDHLLTIDYWELVKTIHKEDQPYFKTYAKFGNVNAIIEDKLLEEYAESKRKLIKSRNI